MRRSTTRIHLMRLCPLGTTICLVAPITLVGVGLLAFAPPQAATQEWEVHDRNRPQPALVSVASCCAAPSDATVLFGGTDTSAFLSGSDACKWIAENGELCITSGSGNVQTKESFGSCQLHIEWMVPETCKCEGQQGCNSGIFFMGRYELQLLGSNPNKTYVDGMAGAMYGQYPPLVNACKPNGQWNMYDVIFTAPKFAAGGDLEQAGAMTVFFNGVLVQNHSIIKGATAHMQKAQYSAHAPKLPISIQDHGDPLRFRNIWIRPLAD